MKLWGAYGILLLSAVLSPIGVTVSAEASSPAHWQAVHSLTIICEFAGGTPELRAQLCDRISAVAAHQAPMPVGKPSQATTPGADGAILRARGTISGMGETLAMAGVVSVELPKRRGSAGREQRKMPIRLLLGKQRMRPDGPIQAVLNELLPWRQMSVTHRRPPPRLD